MPKVRIFSTKSPVEAIGLQNHFNNNQLYHMVIDKRDSPHASVFGYIEFYVNENDKAQAHNLLEMYFVN